MKGEVFAVRKEIPALGEGVLSERIKGAGRIQEVRARFYAGQERALLARPYVLHKGQKAEDLFTFVEGSEPYLSGDDDTFTFPVSVEVENDDELKIWYKNNANYQYTLVLDITIVYTDLEV